MLWQQLFPGVPQLQLPPGLLMPMVNQSQASESLPFISQQAPPPPPPPTTVTPTAVGNQSQAAETSPFITPHEVQPQQSAINLSISETEAKKQKTVDTVPTAR